MTPAQFKYRAEEILSTVRWESILGYPPSHNFVREPMSGVRVRARLRVLGCESSSPLQAMYARFDGLSWPDVRNGYFIKSMGSDTTDSQADGLLVLVAQSDRRTVHEIGSGGGGELILFDCNSGEVLISNGARREGSVLSNPSEIRVVSPSIEGFLDLLFADLEAFTNGIEGELHEYLI